MPNIGIVRSVFANRTRWINMRLSIPERIIRKIPKLIKNVAFTSPKTLAVVITSSEVSAPGSISGVIQSTCKTSNPRRMKQIADMRRASLAFIIFP